MKSKGLKCAALCTAMMMLCGCWDAREIDSLAIVTGIGLDKEAAGEGMHLSLQIGQIGEVSEQGEGKSFSVVSTRGENVLGCMDTLRHENSRELFFHHNQVILFGQDAAKQGVGEFLDVFMRHRESRMEVWVVVAKGSAQQLLGLEVGQEKSSSMALARMVEQEQYIAKAMAVNVLDFAAGLIDESSAPVAPMVEGIEVQGEETRMQVSGLAIFKGDKMAGAFDIPQAHFYAMTMGDLANCILPLTTPYGQVGLIVDAKAPTLDVTLDADGRVTVRACVRPKVGVGELHGFEGMNAMQMMQAITPHARQAIHDGIRESFLAAQEMGADIYGIGEALHRKYPKEWKEMGMDQRGEQVFAQCTLEVDVQLEVIDSGKITDEFNRKGIQHER